MKDWRKHALCFTDGVDVEIFFVPPGDHTAVNEARAICAACPVAQACLDFALSTNQEYGVWAGTTPKQRRRLRREGGYCRIAHHGTRAKYASGCRCNSCAEANARYARQNRGAA